jgi:nitrite reductase/ring-hydroxylating ferredoxin subunit
MIAALVNDEGSMADGDRRTLRPFGGYEGAHSAAEDAELTHVGRGTPCGEYMRRAWQPVALAAQAQERPLAVRVLGEDLVLFRTHRSEWGLLARHCSHRGASLEFGLASEDGIRCCYHGWHYAVDGTIIETPNDPGSRIKEKFCHPAYPAIEQNGIVFAYMGPPDARPPVPRFDTCEEANNDLVPFSLDYPCNWLQVLENTMDPVHSVFLHTRVSGTQFAESWGELPEVTYLDTPLGMMNVNMRRWKQMVWLRTTEVILPNINQAGALYETAETEKTFARVSLTRWMRPSDDRNTTIIGWRHFNDRVDAGLGKREDVGVGKIDFIGQTAERSREEAQDVPGDFEAIVSQRPIAIHALENLCGTDAGVAKLRRLVRRGIRACAQGERPAIARAEFDRPITTFTQDTIREIRRDSNLTEEADRALLRRIGAAGAESLLESAGTSSSERARHLDRALRDLIIQLKKETV